MCTSNITSIIQHIDIIIKGKQKFSNIIMVTQDQNIQGPPSHNQHQIKKEEKNTSKAMQASKNK